MNIFVGNLSFTTTEDELGDIFSEFGQVNAVKIITDRYSSRPRGFAFVEMEDTEEGMNAIEELNGREINARGIVVNEARPRTNDRSRNSERSYSNSRY